MSFDATATIVITSKDRVDDLRKSLHSARQQMPVVEIIVIDDASTDGTAAMVRGEFPGVTLVTHDRPQGYIRGRNEAARLATGNVIVSLDDDAAFSSAGIVGRALEGFSDDRIAAVAIPYVDINRGTLVRQCAPEPEGVYLTASFIGTAHAIRKDRFLQVGGYREELFHQGEESDLCLRLLSAGYVVRLGTGDPIHHFESPKRDFGRMDHYGPRNAILFAWQNAPFPLVIANLLATSVRVMTLTLSPGRFVTRAAGVLSGFGECLRQERRPVSPGVFSLWRRLRGAASPLPLREVTGAFERLGL